MPLRVALLALLTSACTATVTSGDGTTTTTTTTQPDVTPSTTATATTSASPGTSTTGPPETTTTISLGAPDTLTIESFPVPEGSKPHDVAPATDGGVWYTAQARGELGWMDPETGETRHTPLGDRSRPHGVIIDEAGTPWITDGGLNAIVSVDPDTRDVTVYPLPGDRPSANLNTAIFDDQGILWFTGQNGIYGSLNPETGAMEVFDAPLGRGPYGITSTPQGSVFYASLAGSYVGAIAEGGSVEVLNPPTDNQGARRVWSDSDGGIWVSEWNSGNLSRYRPSTGQWETWPLPGADPAAYAVFVDETDIVWASDFGSNSIVRFDPETEEFHSYELPHQPGEVRQILGRPGEVWGAESAADHLVLIQTR